MPSPLPDPPPGFTREQMLRAREAWRKAATATWRDLLDAEPFGEDTPPPPPRL